VTSIYMLTQRYMIRLLNKFCKEENPGVNDCIELRFYGRVRLNVYTVRPNNNAITVLMRIHEGCSNN